MKSLGLPCAVSDEDVFGPIVNSSCRHGFDFTLLFEETIFTFLPILIACPIVLIRLWTLRNVSEKVNRSSFYFTKELASFLHMTLQFTLLIFWCQPSTPTTRATVPTASASVVVSLFCLYLSHLEHFRSLRPSTILCLYHGFTLILDLPRLRTLSLLPDNQTVTVIFAVSLLSRAGVVILEATEKRSLLKKSFSGYAIETTSGIFNRSLYLWVSGLLWKGSKTTLTVDNLPILDDDIKRASNPEHLLDKWNKANRYGRNALLWTFIKHYKWDLLGGILPRMAFTGFLFVQPFLVQRVLDFMTEPEHVNSSNYARGLVAAYGIVYIGIAVTHNVYRSTVYRVIAMVRGSLVSMIFDKTLRMGTSAASDASAVTLMSTDIERIGDGLLDMHETYSNLAEVVLALIFLARLLGIATIASTALVIACLVVGLPISMARAKAQGVWLEFVEERVSVTSKVLGVMRNIKMTGLTDIVADSLRKLRTDEIGASQRMRVIRVINNTISYISDALAPVVGFGLYVILAKANGGPTLTNGTAFAALTLFSLLDTPVVSIVYGTEDLMTVVNCFQRIQKYLNETEREDRRLKLHEEDPILIDTNDDGGKSCVVASHLSAAWAVDDEPILKDLDFDIKRGNTTMIIGPVGCGKSTLLKVLLGEVQECSGQVFTSYRTAAYCSQSPWVKFGTVQENIVGSSCGINVAFDLQQLPSGDQTKVGVRGSRLSGGQQMRVALARALYSRESILILDDVLTGLDRETEKLVLDAVFGGRGIVKELGQTVILATNSAHHIAYSDFVISLNGQGQIAQQRSSKELMANKDYSAIFDENPEQVNTDRAPDVVFDDEQLQELNLEGEGTDEFSRRTGDWTVYLYYFRVMGYPLLFLALACSVFFIAGATLPQIWLQWWTRANEKHPNADIPYWLGGYAAVGILTLFAVFCSIFVFDMLVIPKTARQFHEILLGTTMSATTSFLTSTDIGTTTNRFSQDLELIDEELPAAFEMAIDEALSCLVEGFLVFFGSSYVTAAIIPICIIAVYYVAKFYVRTSRQVRLLDIETKAPLFSHFLETISGLSSIRAYGWTEEYRRLSRTTLDNSQRPFYLLFCIQSWLNLVLDLIVAAIAVTVIAIALALRGNSSLGLLGIALFNIVNFSSTLQSLISEWTGLETSIGAVSRIRSYVREAKTEDLDTEVQSVPSSWPQNGEVKFINMTASYETSSPPVLKGINLVIAPGEKIAICGRTGSGKSSLISTILRTLEIDSGSVLIDGVDIALLSRSRIRSSLNTIPQQAFFLHGSVRLNLNSRQDVSDEKIIDALQETDLWSHIESKGGLDTDMSEDLLSHGQQQLFCLARAMCKSSQIVIMDEATSSVDSDSEKLMQSVIRKHFKDQTIIAIAHKLDTILDYDKIAFMDQGRVIEFDKPQALLSMEKSAFRSLYNSFCDQAS
ncbi:P-loop containing nucleoside triphosphate hydrolase protein [Penicillium chermesinum]|uniref:P-loop containing nucleoside triphosphate hydrolase protein n=1 Tax=Penicillium chermesinum TaxID=63820 RepID=A0A9W9PG80_9EURO|nr:P-loop containing nucleoside triphosphate hydrolase protein [Penicillium chermesinum]KAJ5246170.1 P-loop containing nucleoside triphosphate hydrolase protein [Penicillium chermesinum]